MSGAYTDGRLVEHFSIREMANTKASGTQLVLTPQVVEFAEMLEEFRRWWAKPMTVNSWYRTKEFNAKCGGSVNSAHLKGTAMDWGVSGHTAAQRAKCAAKWQEICHKHGVYGKINYYTHGYHLEAFSNLAYPTSVKWKIDDYRGKKGDW